MSNLITPVEALNMLIESGYRFKSSCNCGGTYWEKFTNNAGDMIKVAPKKDYFKVHRRPIFGVIADLKYKIITI